MKKIGILGIGIYEPPSRKYVDEVANSLSLKDKENIGVTSVFSEETLTGTEMAVIASKEAIKNSGIEPGDIDFIINTQSSLHDYLIWQVSAEVQHQLKATNAKFFDLYQGCSGFLTGLVVAKNLLIGDDDVKLILINTSEKWGISTRNRLVGKLFFGDAAVAVIVGENAKNHTILGYSMICKGNLNDISRARVGAVNHPKKSYPDQYYCYDYTNLEKGIREMIPINISTFIKVGKEAIEKSGLSIKEITNIIFPGVGFGLFEKIVKKFDIPLEATNFRYVSETGDCSTADALFNYYKMLKERIIKEGNNVLMFSQGAGATWIALVIKV